MALNRKGRKRRAWLVNGDGVRYVVRGGKRARLPGYYVGWREFRVGAAPVQRQRHFDKKRIAERFVARHNAREELGLIGEIVPILLSEAIDEYIESCSTIKAATRRQYAGSLIQLLNHLAERELSTVTSDDVDSFLRDRLKGSANRKPQSQGNVNKHTRHLNAFFEWAIKPARNYLKENPVANASAAKRDSPARDRPIISEDALARILSHVENEAQWLVIQISATTGMDREDVQNLTPDAIDFHDMCIRGIRTKSGKPGADPLHPGLVEPLRRFVRGSASGSRLFHGLYYRNAARGVKDWWNRVCEAAGVSGVEFRDLRAYCNRWMHRAPGVTLVDVQKQLRHSDIRTTAKHYNMPDPKVAAATARLPLPGAPEKPDTQQT